MFDSIPFFGTTQSHGCVEVDTLIPEHYLIAHLQTKAASNAVC
jgi:hypothetical protein